MANENDNKLVTLADLAEAYNALYNRDVVTTATQSANGLMSSVDKTKLDGIAAGAQVNSVTSVNNQTGAVSVTPENIGAAYMIGPSWTLPYPVGTSNQSELIANFDHIIEQAPANLRYFCGTEEYYGYCIFWGYSYSPDESDGIRKYADLHYIAIAGHYYHAIKYNGTWTIQDLTDVPSKTGSGASGTWGIGISGNAANVSGVVAIDHGGTDATTPAGARANLQAENTIVTNYTSSDFTTVYLQPYDGRLRAVKKGSMVHLFYAAYGGYSANTITSLFVLPQALYPITGQGGVPVIVTDGNTTVIGYGYADIYDSGLVQMSVNTVGYVQLCVTYIAG